MRISTKGRYALGAMLSLAKSVKPLSAIEIADSLKISKIYLEQVLASLKKAHLLKSNKGASGGYFLARTASEITTYDILLASETALFETTEKDNNDLSDILKNKVYSKIDRNLQELLSGITLEELVSGGEEAMFYI